MGFFDTVKAKAGDLAADAERASKIAAIQARMAVMQQDLKKAERDLGQATFALIERGEITHPELATAVDEVRAAQAAIEAKEEEIAQLRAAAEVPAAEAAAAAAPPSATSPVPPPPVPTAPAPSQAESPPPPPPTPST